MSAPRLSRKLVLEGLSRTPDGSGGFAGNWVALGTLWAEVTARSGRERAESGVPLSGVGYRIVVRAAPQGAPSRPGPRQRFRDGTRIFVIRAVAERDPEGRFLTCFADEEVTA